MRNHEKIAKISINIYSKIEKVNKLNQIWFELCVIAHRPLRLR